MASWTLGLEGLVQLFTCVSFGYVAETLRRRTTSSEARLANRAIVAWWWGLGTYLGMMGALDLLAFVDITPFWLHLLVRLVGIALLAACAWGFCTYVLFLYGGRTVAAAWTGVYGVLAGLLFYAETWVDRPTDVVVTAWSAGLAPPANMTFLQLVYAFFALPLLASIVAYASLLARVQDTRQRYRIVLVSCSLFAWVLGGLLGSASGEPFLQFVAVTLLGLVAAFAVLVAYRPPRAAEAWLARRSDAALARRLATDGRRRLAAQ